jgi:hypothetical protein
MEAPDGRSLAVSAMRNQAVPEELHQGPPSMKSRLFFVYKQRMAP